MDRMKKVARDIGIFLEYFRISLKLPVMSRVKDTLAELGVILFFLSIYSMILYGIRYFMLFHL